MTKLKRLIWLVLVIICVLIGVWLVQENSQDVSVILMGFTMPSLAVGIWLLIAFFAGSLLSLVVSLPGSWQKKSQIRRLLRQLELYKLERQKKS